MNISLPDALKAFVDDQVSQRGYGSSSEYVRDLLRREQDRRVVLAAITESGREVVEQATLGLNQQVFAGPGLTEREVRSLTRLLGRLRAEHGDLVKPLR